MEISKELLITFFDMNPETVLFINIEGSITAANKASMNILQKSFEEIVGSFLYSVLPDELTRQTKPHIEEVIFTGRSVRFESNHAHRYYDNYFWPVFNDDSVLSGIVLFITDITDHKNAEERLRQAEEKFRNIFENTVEGIFSTTPNGQFLSANTALARILGYASPDELMQSVNDIAHQHYVDPNRRTEFMRLINEHRKIHDFEAQMFRKDGSILWISLNAKTVYNKRKKPLYYVGTAQDITEKKKLEARLMHSRKLETIGKLASGMAHDFGNILTIITGNAEIILQQLQPDDKAFAGIKTIMEMSEGAAKLCQQIFNLSYSQTAMNVKVNLNDVVLKIEKMLTHLLGEDIVYEFFLDKMLKDIKADPSLMEQIILDLTVHARERMPGGGLLKISTENISIERKTEFPTGEIPPGEYVLLSISDNGAAILPAQLKHIFEPFHITSPRETGLGLSVVYNIVKQYNGHVTVNSDVQKGTTFTLLFPVLAQSEEKVTEHIPVSEDNIPVSKKKTILLVEDEAQILRVMSEILGGLGYSIIRGIDAEEAISKSALHEGLIDLLITDVVLPGKEGPELAEILRIKYPEIKIVFMSGYTVDRAVHTGAFKGQMHFLQKPITPFVLAMTVQELIGS